MVIEEITFNDLEEIKYLQPIGWNDIIPDFEFYIKSVFCTPIKLKIGNRIVGIGAFITLGNTGWLAHIIVDIDFRGKGIGLFIVNELLGIAKRDSIKTCLLVATDLGNPLYLKAGFKTISDYTVLLRQNRWVGYSGSKNVVPFEEKYRNAIYELDRTISGESRERLLKDFLDNSMLYLEREKVIGYYVPRLKEGTILANTNQAGLELMKVKYAKFDRAVIPSENVVALGFLKQNGFIESSKVPRMIFGDDINWLPQKIFSRIAGNLG